MVGYRRTFRELTDKRKHQVFLFVCPGTLPFAFASHSWFVVNEEEKLSRWEVLFRKSRSRTSWGHLHKNYGPPTRGVEVVPFFEKYFWKGRLLGHVEGEPARRIAEFLKRSPETYSYCRTFSLPGPNSNTYTQWVLDHVPEFYAKLPWNAFGKGYRVS